MELIRQNALCFGQTGSWARARASLIMKIAAIKQVNRLYDDTLSYPGPYPEGLLRNLQVSYETFPEELEHIPRSGAAIVVANHPTGALDGIVLIDLLSKLRPDVRFMGNFLLSRIGPLNRFFISVDPFDSKAQSNISGLRESIRHLQQGGLLVIFPAGEVATWQRGFKEVKDREWPMSVMKFIRRAQVPVIPLHIEASNSVWFRLAGKIHPSLRTLLLPRELMNKSGNRVPVRVASAVLPQKTAVLTDEAYGNYLRAGVEYMKPERKKRRRRIIARRPGSSPERICDEISSEALAGELDRIRKQRLLFSYREFDVYCAPYDEIPLMMRNIGALRERTFREIGEGTKREIDTDRFDRYYLHLFIWDSGAKRLVGAYRLGLGDEIIRQYGVRGFYTYTLFRMSRRLVPILQQTIELGRSFIVKEYQRKPASLMLLWKGILHVLLANTQYRYLLGPVTISGSFHPISRRIIAAYVGGCYLDREKSRWIRPRTGLDIPVRIDESLIAEVSQFDLINKLVCDIERNHFSVPVLIRKYLQLNSSVLGFNTDHDFNGSLDALMLLDLKQVPEDTIRMLAKELDHIDVLSRFRTYQES